MNNSKNKTVFLIELYIWFIKTKAGQGCIDVARPAIRIEIGEIVEKEEEWGWAIYVFFFGGHILLCEFRNHGGERRIVATAYY